MPDLSVKRGAIPSPRSALAAATPHAVVAGAPLHHLSKPHQLSMWGNDVHGDCVTAEEAFAKACHHPEIFIPEADVIAWASRHDVLEGANLPPVMTWMQDDGFVEGSHSYHDANEDHCVSLCGYGTLSWLAGRLDAELPGGVDGTRPGYAMFTWNSIGI